ncbi:MAG: copper transporter [Solirubrobacterales bacterium]
MIDFRYHAMSLAAVFVALALGLLLGVTIGDTDLLTNVRGNLERSLREDVNDARRESATTRRQLESRDQFIRIAYPQMVAGRLTGLRVGVVGSSGATRDVLESVGRAIQPAGAELKFTADLVARPEYAALAKSLKIPDVVDSSEITTAQTERLGRAVGRRLARGRERLALRRYVFGRLSGTIDRVRLYVFARQAPKDLASQSGKLYDAFQGGIVTGLAESVGRIVGVEATSAAPSNVDWYNEHGLSTVDDVEQSAGHYALVLLLGGAKGDYGYKKSADAVIPPVAP